MDSRDLFSNVTHCDMAPNTMQSRQALVTFDSFMALITLGWAVAFNPVMVHDLEQNKNMMVRGDVYEPLKTALRKPARPHTYISVLLGLHIGLDAGRRRSSHAALVHCVLTNCKEIWTHIQSSSRPWLPFYRERMTFTESHFISTAP